MSARPLPILVFWLDDVRLAIRLRHVESLRPCRGVRMVWQAPTSVVGVVHHRGQLVAVLDTAHVLLRREATLECDINIFVEHEGALVALRVSQVEDIVEVPGDAIYPPAAGPLAPFLEAVCAIDDDLLGLINPATLTPLSSGARS